MDVKNVHNVSETLHIHMHVHTHTRPHGLMRKSHKLNSIYSQLLIYPIIGSVFSRVETRSISLHPTSPAIAPDSPSLIARPSSYPQPLNSSWIVPSSPMQWLYNAITAACQTIENDVTSTLGHGGLGLATGACDNLCPAPSPAHPLSVSQKIRSMMPPNRLIAWRPLWLGPYFCVYVRSNIRLQIFPSLLSFAQLLGLCWCISKWKPAQWDDLPPVDVATCIALGKKRVYGNVRKPKCLLDLTRSWLQEEIFFLCTWGNLVSLI